MYSSIQQSSGVRYILYHQPRNYVQCQVAFGVLQATELYYSGVLWYDSTTTSSGIVNSALPGTDTIIVPYSSRLLRVACTDASLPGSANTKGRRYGSFGGSRSGSVNTLSGMPKYHNTSLALEAEIKITNRLR